jgi:hypothetical protein
MVFRKQIKDFFMKLVEFQTTKQGNSKDQVKVQLILGFDYKTMLANDIQKLKSISFEDCKNLCLSKGLTFTDQDLQDAMYGQVYGRKGLVVGMEQSLNGSNPDSTDSQYDKHQDLPFIKVSKKTSEFYITGIIVSEEILVKDTNPTPYKPSNSGIIVQLKNVIKKAMQLETDKLKTYKVDDLNQFKGV